MPQHVTVKLDLFSDRVQQVPATAIDSAGPFLSIIEADDPEQVMKMTVELGARGTVQMTSLAAVPLETFIKYL